MNRNDTVHSKRAEREREREDEEEEEKIRVLYFRWWVLLESFHFNLKISKYCVKYYFK